MIYNTQAYEDVAKHLKEINKKYSQGLNFVTFSEETELKFTVLKDRKKENNMIKMISVLQSNGGEDFNFKYGLFLEDIDKLLSGKIAEISYSELTALINSEFCFKYNNTLCIQKSGDKYLVKFDNGKHGE